MYLEHFYSCIAAGDADLFTASALNSTLHQLVATQRYGVRPSPIGKEQLEYLFYSRCFYNEFVKLQNHRLKFSVI